jgi:hypothetical protein
MKKILIAIFMIFGCRLAFGQRPFTQDLKNLATVNFPDTPQLKRTPGRVYYSLQKNGVIYMASANGWFNGMGDNFTHDLTDTAYASLIREVNRLNESKLFYQKKITINGLRGIEYGFVSTDDSTKFYRYHRALFLNNTIIIYGINSFDSLRIDKKALDDFYATFKVTAPDSDRSQDTIADTLFNFKTLMWAAIALLGGVLIIFIIKKSLST